MSGSHLPPLASSDHLTIDHFVHIQVTVIELWAIRDTLNFTPCESLWIIMGSKNAEPANESKKEIHRGMQKKNDFISKI